MLPNENDIAKAICCPNGCNDWRQCSAKRMIENGAVDAVLSLFQGSVKIKVIKHGHSSKANPTPEYRAWSAMKTRCFNVRARSYKDYGGRGITVCPYWRISFENFLADVGHRPSKFHSLNRINNNGNYEPGNVEWTTADNQTTNRRTTIFVKFRGKRVPLAKVCRILELNRNVIWARIDRGWTPERAISVPIRKQSTNRRS